MTTFIIAQLTIQETQRRRILWLALLLGLLFLVIYGVGFHYIYTDIAEFSRGSRDLDLVVGLLLTAGLYVVNFLIIVMSVLTSVTAVSGEIESHTVETLLTKPIRRWEFVLGKWVGFAAMLLVYIVILVGGIMTIVYWRAGFVVQNLWAGIGLMVLEGLVVLSLTIAVGTRLSTLANGVVAFMLYGLAFIGSWVEQIGALFQNETAVDIGIVASLLMPSEMLWKKALALFQPTLSDNPLNVGPFAVASEPSNLMLVYSVCYALGLLLLALGTFSKRDL
ncbi:MAG: ABC transporter permease subunit [Chloroflexota bacterium]